MNMEFDFSYGGLKDFVFYYCYLIFRQGVRFRKILVILRV